MNTGFDLKGLIAVPAGCLGIGETGTAINGGGDAAADNTLLENSIGKCHIKRLPAGF